MNIIMKIKKEYKKLSQEIAKEFADNKWVHQHNPSMNQAFSHDYVKNLKDKYYILKKGFDIIDNNAAYKLQFKDIEKFFKRKK